MAKMSQFGFEGFIEGDDLIQAYIEEGHYSGKSINQMVDDLSELGIRIQYRFHKQEDKNWNEEWEKKFEPVVIGEEVLIRAPFHGDMDDLPCTLVIEPKMSFGTGHHHTTRLMILGMMNIGIEGKKVLDVGCGTGILGIYASKRGAKSVVAIDPDQWAYENAMENAERNSASSMKILHGDTGVLKDEMFDLILANITRSTLVKDMPVYCTHLLENGTLMISGILAEDAQYVFNAAYRCGLDHVQTMEAANWIMLSFIKPTPDPSM